MRETRRPRGRWRHEGRSGFGAAAFAFLIVMAVAPLPSPLYGLYRARDHLSALTITVVFAIFAVLGFAIFVGLGVAASGWALLGRLGSRPSVTGSRDAVSGEPQ
jgi:hypothetical protein